MRISEKNYEFRKKLLEVHKKGIRDFSLQVQELEFCFCDASVIYLENSSDVILTAAKDFAEFLYTSMNVVVMVAEKKNFAEQCCLSVRLKAKDENLDEANGYMGSSITVTKDKIEIIAYDERGVAQAFYYLEDVMSNRRAPFIPLGNTKRKALFSPRMIHSGYGIDEFPDAHLSQIAHAGMDAILVFVKGVNETTRGFLDFNELIWRASKYGIDVYAYSYLKSEKHPDDPDAESFYEGTYGNLFKNCPQLKGVILVGESIEFPSKDPHTTGKIGPIKNTLVPSEKLRPGWWPCCDFPQWINLIKGIIKKYNKDADLVLWSYNWSRQEEKYRIELIDNLPTDISILATYSRPEIVEFEGVKTMLADYTLSFEGPSEYFLSEAKAAKRRGIRLYAMSNTGGLTWDFGVIPYEPFPYQWERRYKGIIECREKYNLCGLMESHHYGFYPSFVSEFAKLYYFEDSNKEKDGLKSILARRFGRDNVERVNSALEIWSDSIREYVVSYMDQYGPMRIGPAYPICLNRKFIPPQASHAHFGTGILNVDYNPYIHSIPHDVSSPALLNSVSVKQFKKMESMLKEGIEILESIDNPNDELQELIDLGKFIKCSVRTAINVKHFNSVRLKMDNSIDNDVIGSCLESLEQICYDEIRNAEEAIALVQMNSRLGWEPSMEYLCDEEHLRWKIKQVEYVINVELKCFKQNFCSNPLGYKE